MLPQPPHSLIFLPKIECYQLRKRQEIQGKMLQHQTQVLQHHAEKSGKKGNIPGIKLINNASELP
jgi:hypothetical protein